MSHRPARRGFTLIELLVVISVIAILSGMVFAGVTIAKKQSAIVKTKSSLSALGAAITSYRSVSAGYPGDPPSPSWDTIMGTYGTDAADWKVDKSEVWAPKSAAALRQCLTDIGESFGPLEDAWKQTIRYRPARLYPFDTAATIAIDGAEPPARDSFQLWSIGPNKIEEGGEPTSDDLVQWAK